MGRRPSSVLTLSIFFVVVGVTMLVGQIRCHVVASAPILNGVQSVLHTTITGHSDM